MVDSLVLNKTDLVKVEEEKVEKGFFTKMLADVTDAVRFWVGSIDNDLSSSRDIEVLVSKMHECLNPKGGEVSARRNTVALGNLYSGLSECGKIKFLCTLVENFGSNKEHINKKIEEYSKNQELSACYKIERELSESLEPSRCKILKQFISLPDGLKFIVDMRSDILRLKSKHKSLDPLEKELKGILCAWFDVDLLDLHQITWDSSASLLEKLIKYEAVHKIASWNDLKKRLDSDRLCFAFFHYKMPNEPLIFVEVALVDRITNSIQNLLDETMPLHDPNAVNTAIFYSISNTQHGLSGINLGNFLIKRVVEKLSIEFKNVKTFATLSPIPGFVRWLKEDLIQNSEILNDLGIEHLYEEVLRSIDDLGSDITCSDEVKRSLLKLCTYYLLRVKNERGNAYDPVAHFHLSNGASIKQLNWMADSSDKGIGQSAGIMANYLYELSKIGDNHENYMVNKSINCLKKVSSIIK